VPPSGTCSWLPASSLQSKSELCNSACVTYHDTSLCDVSHSKQVRSDVASTKEQLRNAVSRAPLVLLQPFAARRPDGTSVSGAGSVDLDEECAPFQGPDPRPPNAAMAVSSAGGEDAAKAAAVREKDTVTAATPDRPADISSPVDTSIAATGASSIAPSTAGASGSASATRVPISFADDSDSDGEPTKTRSYPGKRAVSEGATPAANSIDPATPVKPAVVKGGSVTSSTKSKKASTKNDKVVAQLAEGPIKSSYELEKALKLAGTDRQKLAGLFERLKLTQLGKVLADLMEPSVLHRLLSAVYAHFAEHNSDTAKAVEWFSTVRGVKKFSHQYALLDGDLRAQVVQKVRGLKERVEGRVGVSPGQEATLSAVVDELLTVY
jgi:hypothetical protein